MQTHFLAFSTVTMCTPVRLNLRRESDWTSGLSVVLMNIIVILIRRAIITQCH
jgi:hypothetical protein